jgi:hypothetical protein
MPRPKFGRSRPTTAPAAPATFRLVHLQVVGHQQMAIAADLGYGHGLEDTFQGKAHHISFGCSKARPATTNINSFGIKLLRACCRAQWRASDALNDAVRHERAFS